MYKSYNDLIDIVDDDDNVIGQKTRGEAHEKGLQHREIHVWIFDENKNIYFQKRAPGKSHAGMLDASVGGHVDQGEDHLSGAKREMLEETGIDPEFSDLRSLLKWRDISKNEKGETNKFLREVFIYTKPILAETLETDSSENSGFEKFSVDLLKNIEEKDKTKFIKFVLDKEIPHVIKYLESLS